MLYKHRKCLEDHTILLQLAAVVITPVLSSVRETWGFAYLHFCAVWKILQQTNEKYCSDIKVTATAKSI